MLNQLNRCVENIKSTISNHADLKYLTVVLDAISKLIDETDYAPSPVNELVLHSHIEAIHHCLRFYLGKPVHI